MKTNLLAFFTAMFLTFGITSLEIDNYYLTDNVRYYTAILIGAIVGIVYFIQKKKERSNLG